MKRGLASIGGILWFGAALGLITGCSSGPGRGFSLFPQGHQLTDAAKSLREANARPLHVPRELEKQPQPAYRVEPGDVLLVQPMSLDSPVRLPGDQPVLPDGTINLGKYGHLPVMGRTVVEIEDMVRSAVEAHTKDAGFIGVRLISRQSKVFYVLGEVNSPGSFELAGRETVLDGILKAGGLTDQASRDNIILSRPTAPNCPRIVLPVCWKNIVQLGDTTTNYQLSAGDRIYVATRHPLESMPLLKRHKQSGCDCPLQAPFALPPYNEPCHASPDVFTGTPILPVGGRAR